jgi:hypothetical protein
MEQIFKRIIEQKFNFQNSKISNVLKKSNMLINYCANRVQQ